MSSPPKNMPKIKNIKSTEKKNIKKKQAEKKPPEKDEELFPVFTSACDEKYNLDTGLVDLSYLNMSKLLQAHAVYNTTASSVLTSSERLKKVKEHFQIYESFIVDHFKELPLPNGLKCERGEKLFQYFEEALKIQAEASSENVEFIKNFTQKSRRIELPDLPFDSY
ncbi:Serine--tRNA ligase [Trichinella pseudospiralis]